MYKKNFLSFFENSLLSSFINGTSDYKRVATSDSYTFLQHEMALEKSFLSIVLKIHTITIFL